MLGILAQKLRKLSPYNRTSMQAKMVRAQCNKMPAGNEVKCFYLSKDIQTECTGLGLCQKVINAT